MASTNGAYCDLDPPGLLLGHDALLASLDSLIQAPAAKVKFSPSGNGAIAQLQTPCR